MKLIIIILICILIILLLLSNRKKYREGLTIPGLDKLTDGINTVKDFAQSLPSTFDNLKNDIKGLGNKVQDAADKAVKPISDQLKDARGGFNTLGDKIQDVANTAVKPISDQLKDARGGFNTLGDKIQDVANTAVKPISDQLKDARGGFNTLGDKIQDVANTAVKPISDQLKDARGGFNTLGDKIKNVADEAVKPISEQLNNAKGGFNTLGDKIKNVAVTEADVVRNFAITQVNAAKEFATAEANRIKTEVGNDFKTVKTFAETSVEKIKQEAKTLKDETVGKIDTLIYNVKQVIKFITNFPQKINDILTGLGKILIDGLVTPFTSIFGAVNSIFSLIVASFEQIIDKIVTLPSCLSIYLIKGWVDAIYAFYIWITPTFLLDIFDAIASYISDFLFYITNCVFYLIGLEQVSSKHNYLSWITGYGDSLDKCVSFNLNDNKRKMLQSFDEVKNSFANYGKMDFSSIKFDPEIYFQSMD